MSVNIRTNPMLKLTVFCWSSMGYILGNKHRLFFFLPPVFLLYALEMSFLCFSGEKLELLILNLYFFMLYFNTWVRAVFVIKRSFDYEKFMEHFCRIYNHILDSGDEVSIRILKEQSEDARLFERNNLLLGFFSCACFWIYPIFTGQRELPYGLYIPGIDNRVSPFYECAYISQILATLCGCCVYMPFSSLFTSFMKLGIVLIKILQHKLNTIVESSSSLSNTGDPLEHKVIQRKLNHCIEFHWRIIEYIDQINDLGATVCLVELLAFGILLCALLFLLITVTNVPQLIMAGCYVVLIMVQLFIPYWNANEVILESTNIGEALYNTLWYRFNITNRKIALMIIRRTQRPLKIMIGNFCPISLQMFQSILNVSYTYFTVLRGVYK